MTIRLFLVSAKMKRNLVGFLYVFIDKIKCFDSSISSNTVYPLGTGHSLVLFFTYLTN
jgi:hypothetical protein